VLSGHCEAAARLGDRLGLGAGVVAGLGQLYERWDGKGLPGGLKAQAIEPAVRVVNFVHDAMVLAAGLTGEELVRTLRRRSGHAYAPDVVAAFIERREHLLDLPADEGVWEAALSRQPSPATAMTDAALDAALLVVADFIDLKSPSVAGHSRAVATLAERAGGILGLPSGDVANLKRAGLLHDLGFAAIPARLCFDEQAGGEQARLHPYYGERLLGRCPSLAPVTALVAEHHERLDGSGFHRGSREMSIPGRVLAAAEAYQGLVENRPFRVSLSPRQAAQSLRDEVRRGALDGAAVDAVLEAAGHRLRNRKPLAVAGLTAREMEILRLVARGGSARAIASVLGVAPKTIDNHIHNIYGKIGVGTRAGATLFAVESGILMPGAEVGE
jgi:HD-GYP domain-containing protein (c-di-GMP phosphodiesterase class II)